MTILPLPPLRHTAETAPASPAASPAANAAATDAGPRFSAALDAAFAGKGPQSGAPGELQQFEGFVLRTFVEAMLPKENASFFGSGTAGDIWRSMMAERLGEEIAAGGGIGIADLLARNPDAAALDRAGDALRSNDQAGRAAGLAKPSAL